MRIRILVVDDHELIRTGLRLRLQGEDGFEVVGEAADAASACAMIGEKSPDIVVMDIGLPEQDGLAATRTIKTRWPKTRVLALTGMKPGTVARATLLAGVDGLVFKSEASDYLVRAVRTVMAGKVYFSPEAATALAPTLREPPPPMPATGEGKIDLSARERSVLKGLAEGLSYKELAAELGLSVKSIDTYRARLVKKLGCSSRAALVRCAVRLGLVSL
ncbi:response regulator transcription factor [Opitutus sp. ER46]|uniref:response regulator n=1 Tax=Opitutus sp. ER46 TaxID=2161864 RepID=UPI001304C36B|nr:response regulator transcription factor [Opitutus sp. ER46]